MALALPKMIMPPQSPGLLSPIAWLEVKIIGREAVPSAINFPPRATMSAAFEPLSPLMIVPAGMVKVAPLRT